MQLLKTFLIQYVSPIGLSPKKLLRKERNPDIEGKMRPLVSDRLWLKPCLLNLFGLQFYYLEKTMITHGKGNGNPLQYSFLENPLDREAWWATVHRVSKSWTWLKWLSTHTSTCAVILSIREDMGKHLSYWLKHSKGSIKNYHSPYINNNNNNNLRCRDLFNYVENLKEKHCGNKQQRDIRLQRKL